MITIYTGDPSEGWGGTDANVHIILCGNKGETDKIELKKSNLHWNKFEQDQLDEFDVKDVKDIGELDRIRY